MHLHSKLWRAPMMLERSSSCRKKGLAQSLFTTWCTHMARMRPAFVSYKTSVLYSKVVSILGQTCLPGLAMMYLYVLVCVCFAPSRKREGVMYISWRFPVFKHLIAQGRSVPFLPLCFQGLSVLVSDVSFARRYCWQDLRRGPYGAGLFRIYVVAVAVPRLHYPR